MRKFLALMAVVLLVSSTGIALAKVSPGEPSFRPVTQAPMPGYLADDIPIHQVGALRPPLVDQIFGFYTVRAGVKYAVLGEEWTFDHTPVPADPLEGWTSIDQTNNDKTYWHRVTRATWIDSTLIVWPAMTGTGMVLCGATKGHADTLGWIDGIGYGNDWCQRLTSPAITYDGTGTVDLTLNYFSEAEVDYDYTKIFIEAGTGRVMINAPGFTGKIGIDSTGVITPVAYAKTLSNSDLGGPIPPGARPFHIVLEFKSDGGLSDEDNSGPGADTFYGAVGIDDIGLTGDNLVPVGAVAYGFESSLQGWTATKCEGIGTFMGLANMGDYIITDPCACVLVENVLEMHNDQSPKGHPVGQAEELATPIVDRVTDIPNYLDYNRIYAEWDQYTDLPLTNGVLYRPGWKYYPFENPHVPGMIGWSPRVGQATWYYAGDTPACVSTNSIGTDWGLATNAQQVKFIYEISADCVAFGIDPCSGVTNFTPLIDNITIHNVGYVNAPVALYEPGTRFQDGFGQSALGVLTTTDPGTADVVHNTRMGLTSQPTLLGDSLMVTGPVPSSPATKWEAKLWFRLRRAGPGQGGNATFNTWQAAVEAGKGVTVYPLPALPALPDFAWGYMDSVQIPAAQRHQFCSQFRELAPAGGLTPEPCFNWGGGGEQSEGNEILPDLAFTPGTKIEYFVTTNYISTPTSYYFYPDTLGGVYSEFEILPSFRTVSGTDKFPCVLYVDAFNGGAQYYIENALNVVLNGLATGAPVPDPTAWDRYDYLDASSNWNGPLYREGGGNSGATIPQLLGYKLIVVSLGTASTGSMEPRDWQGFQQWLDAIACTGNANLQGFIADGTSVARIINDDYPYLLNNTLAATYKCRTYNEDGCPTGETQNDQQSCVRVEAAPGAQFVSGVASDVSGNWCPSKFAYNVLGATGTGIPNKQYEKIGTGYKTNYAQIVNNKAGLGGPNYRSVIESFSYHLLTTRDGSGLSTECERTDLTADTLARVTAAYKEIESAVKWTLNITNPATQVGLCINPCDITDVPDEAGAGVAVTRLYQNRPNPFNPRTAIKFSLAADGPAKLIIYDVNGRRIRTLVDRGLKAGTHEEVWDGTDDAGHTVTSGVYWSQLQAGAYSSNKKMVVLK